MTMSHLQPVVVKVGGKAIDDARSLRALAASLARAAASAPIIVVHGGGVAVDRRLAGREIRRVAGLRVTPPDQIDIIADVLGREVNGALVEAINRAGRPAVGLTLDKAMATARVLRGPAGEDLGRVGELTGGDPGALRALLAEGVTPVVACIGRDADGPLNINADTAAAGVARFTGAVLVVLLTDAPGVLDGQGAVIGRLDSVAIDELIAGGVIHGGMIPKVRAAMDVARSSGAPALIASWADPDALALALEGGGAGTRVCAAPGPERRRASGVAPAPA
ncbi:MAG: acetylglutamate kinase [Phycisphaerales bacterium JB039]